LFLDYQVTLDREDTAALTKIKKLDQVRIDVQLRAVLAQPTRDTETQPLTAIRETERGVEPGRDEPAATGGTAISSA
jgi:hypothetical protein